MLSLYDMRYEEMGAAFNSALSLYKLHQFQESNVQFAAIIQKIKTIVDYIQSTELILVLRIHLIDLFL